VLRLLEGEVNFIGDLILYIWRCDRTGHIKFRIKKQNMCSLNELLTDLDNANELVAIDAQNSLEIRGEEAIKPVLSLLPSLGLYGQCCALDLLISWPIVLLQSADNPSTSDVLIPLLLSQNPYIRESSAFILGKVGAKEAIPAIEQALKKVKAEGIPLDYSEPVAYRNIPDTT
jgi:HEAT repeat protein